MSESPNPYIIDADTLTGQMRPIRRCVISMGSNLGDRMAKLQGGLDSLADTPEVWLTAVSGVYETEPVDAPEGSKSFLNAVVLFDSTLEPRTLLERAQAIEDVFARERSGAANEPRTLDIDLIVVGDRPLNEPDLILPHPRAHQRGFVLVPWAEIEADGELPGVGVVSELLAEVGTEGVVHRGDLELQL